MLYLHIESSQVSWGIKVNVCVQDYQQHYNNRVERIYRIGYFWLLVSFVTPTYKTRMLRCLQGLMDNWDLCSLDWKCGL